MQYNSRKSIKGDVLYLNVTLLRPLLRYPHCTSHCIPHSAKPQHRPLTVHLANPQHYTLPVLKCPNGIYAEIKYDGERVQVHKKGGEFVFFSRSLKPVTAHKVEFFREVIKTSCPHGDTMILDAEVLLVDKNTNKPLPFGTLGVHKKSGAEREGG